MAYLLALVFFLVVWGANGRVKQYRSSAGRSVAPVALLAENEQGGSATDEPEHHERHGQFAERWLRAAEPIEWRGRLVSGRRPGERHGAVRWGWMESLQGFVRPPPAGDLVSIS